MGAPDPQERHGLMQTRGGRAGVVTGPGRTTESVDSEMKFGAGEGIRTLDPNLGKVVLYP